MPKRHRHASGKQSFAKRVKRVIQGEAEKKYVDKTISITGVGPSSVSAITSYGYCPNNTITAGTAENQRIGDKISWSHIDLKLFLQSGGNAGDDGLGFMRVIVGWSYNHEYADPVTVATQAAVVESTYNFNSSPFYSNLLAPSKTFTVLMDRVVNLNRVSSAPTGSTNTLVAERQSYIHKRISLKGKTTTWDNAGGNVTSKGAPFLYICSTDSLAANHSFFGQMRLCYTDI